MGYTTCATLILPMLTVCADISSGGIHANWAILPGFCSILKNWTMMIPIKGWSLPQGSRNKHINLAPRLVSTETAQWQARNTISYSRMSFFSGLKIHNFFLIVLTNKKIWPHFSADRLVVTPLPTTLSLDWVISGPCLTASYPFSAHHITSHCITPFTFYHIRSHQIKPKQ